MWLAQWTAVMTFIWGSSGSSSSGRERSTNPGGEPGPYQSMGFSFCQVPMIQKVQKVVDVPQIEIEEQVVEVPVAKHVQVPMSHAVRAT